MALNKSEITKLLSKEQLVYIATVKQNGNPHIAPIWFVYHQGKIYFETDKTTVKFVNYSGKNMAKIWTTAILLKRLTSSKLSQKKKCPGIMLLGGIRKYEDN